MLNVVQDQRALKITSEALARPKVFFAWATSQSPSARSKEIIRNAEKYFPVATWQWDKACILPQLSCPRLRDSDGRRCPRVATGVGFSVLGGAQQAHDQGKAALHDVVKLLGATYREPTTPVSLDCEAVQMN